MPLRTLIPITDPVAQERERLRDALRWVNVLAGTAEQPLSRALDEICRVSYAALHPTEEGA